MTATPVTTEGTRRLAPSRDERLVPYCLIAIGGLGASVLTGQPALAALALPFALALALGLRRSTPQEVRARVTLDADQVLEGDLVTGRIALEWDRRYDAHLLLHRLAGVLPISPDITPSWSFPAGTGSAEVQFEVQAARWGRHIMGEVWLRLATPSGLVMWTGMVVSGPTLRVLPESDRLNRLLDPVESHAVLGMHRSRRLGDGQEFAELRPYTPGDRLRDLNWGATARHRRPFVNRHHPEVSGDLLIAIDTFTDGSVSSTDALARAARAAWALASIHLQANDRVGLIGLGGRTQWLPPAGGRQAKYLLLETLLGVGGELVSTSTSPARHVRIAVPVSALVVVLTPLHARSTVDTLEWLRARGRSVAAMMIDTRNLLREPESPAEALAWRLWSMELEQRKRELADLGIPVVTVADDGPIGQMVSALRRARKTPAVRRGR
ncbi:MAG: DUF58 domain-containing protein [Gemmatimonas sp.]|nr:DUF58 domain-containing protein [Gemmatimonas sp.]